MQEIPCIIIYLGSVYTLGSYNRFRPIFGRMTLPGRPLFIPSVGSKAIEIFRPFSRAGDGDSGEGTSGDVNGDGGGEERHSRAGAVPADRLRRRLHRRRQPRGLLPIPPLRKLLLRLI